MYINSRYANGHTTPAVTPEGDAVMTVSRTWPTAQGDYLVYRWKAGDRIDRIAGALSIPRIRWTVIMDINPQLVVPTAIAPGTIIRIPKATP